MCNICSPISDEKEDRGSAPAEIRRSTTATAGAYVVVPAYNEAQVIREVIKSLSESFSNIIVVNDGSTDPTIQVLRDLDVTVISHAINIGQGAALQTGIIYALSKGAQCIVTFDADGQHRVEDAICMLEVLQEGGCDVVLGSRFLGGAVNMPMIRWFLLRSAIWLRKLATRSALTDAHNGLRALNRKAATVLDITLDGMAHASQIIKQLSDAKMTICEVPVTIEYTGYSLRKGQSSTNALNILAELIVARFLR